MKTPLASAAPRRLVLLATLLLTVPAWSLDLPNPKEVIREVRGKIHRVAREVKGAVRAVAVDAAEAARHDDERRVHRTEVWEIREDERDAGVYPPYAPDPYARSYPEEPSYQYYKVPPPAYPRGTDQRVPYSSTDPSPPLVRPGAPMPYMPPGRYRAPEPAGSYRTDIPADRLTPGAPPPRAAVGRDELPRDSRPREPLAPEPRREAMPLPEAAPQEPPPSPRSSTPPRSTELPRTGPISETNNTAAAPGAGTQASRPSESTPPPKVALPPGDDRAGYARAVPGKPGLVYPPGAEETSENWVDVREFKSGQLVRNPRTGKLFRVP